MIQETEAKGYGHLVVPAGRPADTRIREFGVVVYWGPDEEALERRSGGLWAMEFATQRGGVTLRESASVSRAASSSVETTQGRSTWPRWEGSRSSRFPAIRKAAPTCVRTRRYASASDPPNSVAGPDEPLQGCATRCQMPAPQRVPSMLGDCRNRYPTGRGHCVGMVRECRLSLPMAARPPPVARWEWCGGTRSSVVRCGSAQRKIVVWTNGCFDILHAWLSPLFGAGEATGGHLGCWREHRHRGEGTQGCGAANLPAQ